MYHIPMLLYYCNKMAPQGTNYPLTPVGGYTMCCVHSQNWSLHYLRGCSWNLAPLDCTLLMRIIGDNIMSHSGLLLLDVQGL